MLSLLANLIYVRLGPVDQHTYYLICVQLGNGCWTLIVVVVICELVRMARLLHDNARETCDDVADGKL